MSREEDKRITSDTYRNHADKVEEKFIKLEPHAQEIERAFELCQNESPNVLEIGFGGGRDAKLLMENAGDYVGIDVSPGLAAIAQKKFPNGKFIVADVEEYEFPPGLDAVFAFASLHFFDKDELSGILHRITKSLSHDGILLLEVKLGEYRREIKEIEYGTRIFYFYDRNLLESLVPQELETVSYKEKQHSGNVWLTIIFQKK